ncbi:MAG: TetR/AcrR family transcriptional regulator [Nocardioidaceae bacterium]
MSEYRGDTKRNRQALFDALETMLTESDRTLSVSEVAVAASISPATTYRYFGSMDGMLIAYRQEVITRFRRTREQLQTHGLDLLRDTCSLWVDIVLERGLALAHARSREGYLARLNSGSSDLLEQERAVEPPLTEACEELGIANLGRVGLFIWSQIYDPRDVLDLKIALSLSTAELKKRLLAALMSYLCAWHEAQ